VYARAAILANAAGILAAAIALGCWLTSKN
jgi:hypothetical protein